MASPNGTQNQNGQQVTAQVAVVQAQESPNGGQHFITVSGKFPFSLFSAQRNIFP